LDSTAYFPKGKTKAKCYVVSTNFPLYYAQEWDSIHSSSYAQVFHLMSNNNDSKTLEVNLFGRIQKA